MAAGSIFHGHIDFVFHRKRRRTRTWPQMATTFPESSLLVNAVYEKVHISVRVKSGLTDLNSSEFFNRWVVCLSADPSMTVRTDITGRYSNHLYTYEPKDMNSCEWIKEQGTAWFSFLLHHLWNWKSVNVSFTFVHPVAESMKKAKVLLKNELWAELQPAPQFSCSFPVTAGCCTAVRSQGLHHIHMSINTTRRHWGNCCLVIICTKSKCDFIS